MSDWRVRTARRDDLDALFALAKSAGGGFTTLPADYGELRRKLERHERSMAELDSPPEQQQVMLLLENIRDGSVAGTGNICAKLGGEWPFYIYRTLRLTHSNRQLNTTVAVNILQLVNEFDGATEVGGLFLSAGLRGNGLGRMLARSRYLFIAQHRRCIADRVVAEMRGYHTADGRSAFWNAVERHFFAMEYLDADHFNAVSGNQFIADLMPKFPIYVSTLPPDAQAVIGKPHREGRRAYELLLEEGFRDDGCVDIFDAGPTLWTLTEQLAAVKDSRTSEVAEIGSDGSASARQLVTAGVGSGFRVSLGDVVELQSGQVWIDAASAALLNIQPGQSVRHVRL